MNDDRKKTNREILACREEEAAGILPSGYPIPMDYSPEAPRRWQIAGGAGTILGEVEAATPRDALAALFNDRGWSFDQLLGRYQMREVGPWLQCEISKD